MKFLFKHKIPLLFVSILIILLVSVFSKDKPVQVQVQAFTDLSGCNLDCSDKDVMLAMKKEFESNYLEGFQSKEGFQTLFPNPVADIQSQLQAQFGPQVQAQLLTNFLSSSTGLPPSVLNSITTAATVPIVPTAATAKKLTQYTLRTVSRAAQISPLKCEYEITYDKTDVDLKGVHTNLKDQFGYFQATFTKNSGGACGFTPTDVRLLIGPEISKMDAQGKQSDIPQINYSF
jgi:hypothetical protein